METATLTTTVARTTHTGLVSEEQPIAKIGWFYIVTDMNSLVLLEYRKYWGERKLDQDQYDYNNDDQGNVS